MARHCMSHATEHRAEGAPAARRQLRGAAAHAVDRRRRGEIAAARAFETSLALVARRNAVDPAEARRRRARRPAVEAKQIALYLAVTCFGEQLRPVSRAAGIAASTALRAVRAIEDRRDAPAFDRQVGAFEAALMGAAE